MSRYSERITERIAVQDYIKSQAGTAGTYLTGAVAISTGRRFLLIVNAGDLGASATVDAEIDWSATSGGTYAKMGTSSITQVTATGDAVYLIEVSAEAVMNAHPTAAFLKGKVVTATAATPISAVLISVDGRYDPVSQGSVVGQTVTNDA